MRCLTCASRFPEATIRICGCARRDPSEGRRLRERLVRGFHAIAPQLGSARHGDGAHQQVRAPQSATGSFHRFHPSGTESINLPLAFKAANAVNQECELCERRFSLRHGLFERHGARAGKAGRRWRTGRSARPRENHHRPQGCGLATRKPR